MKSKYTWKHFPREHHLVWIIKETTLCTIVRETTLSRPFLPSASCFHSLKTRRTRKERSRKISFSYKANRWGKLGVIAWITWSVIGAVATVHHDVSQTHVRSVSKRLLSMFLLCLFRVGDWRTHMVSRGYEHIRGTPSFIRHDIKFDLWINSLYCE